MSEWFEDDVFWEQFAPVMFDEDRWAGSRWEAEGAIHLSRTAGGAAVLDSCCGVGRHAVEFAKMGFSVTAVDRTTSYIDAARETAEGLNIEFIVEDARRFRRVGTYDLAVNLFTSFGFFATIEEEQRYVKNILESLRPGGCFLIDLNGKELLARDFIDSEAWERNGCLVYTEYAIEDNWGSLANHWVIVDTSGRRYDYRFHHRLYSARELETLLLECGFASTEVYGGFSGAPYDQDAERLIVCGKKSGTNREE